MADAYLVVRGPAQRPPRVRPGPERCPGGVAGLLVCRRLRCARLRLPVSLPLLTGLLPVPVLSRHSASTALFPLATWSPAEDAALSSRASSSRSWWPLVAAFWKNCVTFCKRSRSPMAHTPHGTRPSITLSASLVSSSRMQVPGRLSRKLLSRRLIPSGPRHVLVPGKFRNLRFGRVRPVL